MPSEQGQGPANSRPRPNGPPHNVARLRPSVAAKNKAEHISTTHLGGTLGPLLRRRTLLRWQSARRRWSLRGIGGWRDTLLGEWTQFPLDLRYCFRRELQRLLQRLQIGPLTPGDVLVA